MLLLAPPPLFFFLNLWALLQKFWFIGLISKTLTFKERSSRFFLFNLDISYTAILARNKKANEFGCMTRPHILPSSLNCWLNGKSRLDLQSTTEQLQLKRCTCNFLNSFLKISCDMKAYEAYEVGQSVWYVPAQHNLLQKKFAFSFFVSCKRAGRRRQ